MTFTATGGSRVIFSGSLLIDSLPFTTTNANLFDRFKYFLVLNNDFDISSGVVSFNTQMRVELNPGIAGSPYSAVQIPDPSSDLRVAHGAFITYDPTSRFFFSFLITGTRIYVGYERLVNDTDIPLGSVATFSFAVPVVTIADFDFHNYAIIFNSTEFSVKWIFDGNEVYKIYTTGSIISRQFMIMDGGGQQVMFYPPSMRVGFGTFSYIDAYSPCNVVTTDSEGGSVCQFPSPDTALSGPLQIGLLNPRNGITPATYFVTPSIPTSRIWGSLGAQILVDFVEVLTCQDGASG